MEASSWWSNHCWLLAAALKKIARQYSGGDGVT